MDYVDKLWKEMNDFSKYNTNTKQVNSITIGDRSDYKDATQFANQKNTTFADAGDFNKTLTEARKAAKKDMTKPENWTQDMVNFYNYLLSSCMDRAKAGFNYFVCNGTGTPKTYNFVLDYLRDRNNIMYVRESCKGIPNVTDGVYFRLIWG